MWKLWAEMDLRRIQFYSLGLLDRKERTMLIAFYAITEIFGLLPVCLHDIANLLPRYSVTIVAVG
jgi:hypothetical protein